MTESGGDTANQPEQQTKRLKLKKFYPFIKSEKDVQLLASMNRSQRRAFYAKNKKNIGKKA